MSHHSLVAGKSVRLQCQGIGTALSSTSFSRTPFCYYFPCMKLGRKLQDRYPVVSASNKPRNAYVIQFREISERSASYLYASSYLQLHGPLWQSSSPRQQSYPPCSRLTHPYLGALEITTDYSFFNQLYFPTI